MSSIQHLREFIRERLTAAAEEIFTEVEKTIVRYEEDIRLLEIYWKPQIKLHRVEFTRSHASNEWPAAACQQLCNKGMASGHDQEESESNWEEENRMESGYPPIEDNEEPKPPWIMEEGKTPEPLPIKKENEELESKWEKEDLKKPDLLLNKKLDDLKPPWNEEDEKLASPSLEVQDGQDLSVTMYEQGQLEHLPLGRDQKDLSNSREEEQPVQRQCTTLMETFTFQEVDSSPRKGRTEQPSFQRPPAVENRDQKGSTSTVSDIQTQTDTEKRSFKHVIHGRVLCNKFTMKQHYKPNTELGMSHVSNDKAALAIPQLCNQGRRSGHDQEESKPNWIKENQIEPDHPPIEEQDEPRPPGIKEEEETPELALFKEYDVEPEPKWAKEDPNKPDLLLYEELDEPGPPSNKNDEKQASLLLEVKVEKCASVPIYEQGQLEHLPPRRNKDLSSNQEEEQPVQKQSIDLMEALTSHKVNLSKRKPRPEQSSYYRPPLNEDRYQEGSSSTVSDIHCQTNTIKGSFKCEKCGRYFKNKYALNQHYKTHADEKPFTCKTCGKGFLRVGHLNNHLKTHTGEKPFTCTTCGKGFSQISSLNVHIRTHTGEKPFTCKTCGKSFSQLSTLRGHSRSHTGEKPFTCKICGKSFSWLSTLRGHSRSHTGERPFICTTCGKSYTHMKNLKYHTRTHSKETIE